MTGRYNVLRFPTVMFPCNDHFAAFAAPIVKTMAGMMAMRMPGPGAGLRSCVCAGGRD